MTHQRRPVRSDAKASGKSGKQRRQELEAKRQARAAEAVAATAAAKKLDRDAILRNQRRAGAAVDVDRLASTNSYGRPAFVERGYYVDQPFTCRSCGLDEVWTARQQKWWYEIAQGDVWTAATRCRACRKRERDRKSEARRVHLEGLASKRHGPRVH
jgi:hypothetical protein